MANKLLVFSAPSGSGKSTIVNWLMREHPELRLAFSVSCTSRAPRGTERDGVEYFFISPEEFREKIAREEFLEYEEVYADRFYGTLKSQVERQLAEGQTVVFDVDVKGALNIKRFYGERALSLFIQPPSLEELRKRLEGRATDAPEVIEQRLAKADYELSFAPRFDKVVVNDDLETAEQEVYRLVKDKGVESMERKTIGIYGGSFNPIHMGHVTLARQLLGRHLLDEVWLMVSPLNPLKADSGQLLSDEIRLRLAQKAVEGERGLRVCDLEFHLPRPSYTWNTLQVLRERYPLVDWVLLIGSDNWRIFPNWYRHEDILRTFRLLVYPRKGTEIIPESLPKGVTLAPTPLIDISSTQVRQRVRSGLSITGMVPPAIERDVISYYKNIK